MEKLMKCILGISAMMTITFAVLYQYFNNSFVLSLIITFATITYHFLIRLMVGGVCSFFMKNKADYTKCWFRVGDREWNFYKIIKVKKWKGKMPTYIKDTFDITKHTWDEILQATCQSELVHEVNVVFSFLPILASIWVGAFEVFFITSILSAVFDLMFVFMQRFNRTRIMKMQRKVYKFKK